MKTVTIFAMMMLGMLVSAGCTGVYPIGTAGDTKYFNVHAANLDGPNATVIVAVKDGQSTVVQSYGGPGLLTEVAPAAVTAGGNVWAANQFGTHLRPDSVSVGGGNATGGDAAGGTSSATGGKGVGGGASATGGSGTGGTAAVDQSRTTDNHSVDNRVDNSNHVSTQDQTVNIGR